MITILFQRVTISIKFYKTTFQQNSFPDLPMKIYAAAASALLVLLSPAVIQAKNLRVNFTVSEELLKLA